MSSLRYLLALVVGLQGCADPPAHAAGSSSTATSATVPSPSSATISSAPPIPRNPVNVLLLSVDALRADMPWAGYARDIAPNLTQFARENVVFEQYRATTSFTAQSVPAMLSGRLASTLYRTGYFFAEYTPANDFLPEQLQRHQIHTVGLHAHHYFRAGHKGLDQGFDVWEVLRGISGQDWSLGPITADKMTDRLIELLSDPAQAGRPFFAWAHYMDPHHEPGYVYTKHPEAPDFGTKPRDIYDGEVFFTDLQIGRLLRWAQDQPWWSRTAVFVTADHGEAFGEHEMFQHAHELWEVLVRIPMLVHVPGASARRIKTPHSHLDLAPTICELMGQPPAPEMMGHSLVAEIFGASRPPGPILLEIAGDTDQTPRRALVSGRLKIIRFGPGKGWKHELYDLGADPAEEHDLSKERPDELAAQIHALDTAFAAVPSVTPFGGMSLEDGTVANGNRGPDDSGR